MASYELRTKFRLGPLAVVGAVRCMGRSLGIAGELSTCALFVFSSGLAAFGCFTFACK